MSPPNSPDLNPVDYAIWSQGPAPDFAGGGTWDNIEDGSSLIIHWSSGSHIKDQRTAYGLINTTHFILVGAPTGGV